MRLWLNGEVEEENRAFLPATAAGTLSGRGVFSTLGIANARPLWPARHFARLHHDAAALDLSLPFDEANFNEALRAVITANAIDFGLMRVTLTARGDGRWNEENGADCSIVARVGGIARQPLRVWLSPYFWDARRPGCGLKSTSYEAYNLLWRAARQRGYDEGIGRESSGALCECARHNLFWVRDKVLYTPSLDSGCLPGIGRSLVLEWAAQHQIRVEQELFGSEELRRANEVFVTNAVHGPHGVSEIGEERAVLTFAAGRVTKWLQKRWDEAVAEERCAR